MAELNKRDIHNCRVTYDGSSKACKSCEVRFICFTQDNCGSKGIGADCFNCIIREKCDSETWQVPDSHPMVLLKLKYEFLNG